MTRESIATVLKIHPEAVDMEVTLSETRIDKAVRTVREARTATRQARERESRVLRESVRLMVAEGISYRDIGSILKISYQRVFQLNQD